MNDDGLYYLNQVVSSITMMKEDEEPKINFKNYNNEKQIFGDFMAF